MEERDIFDELVDETKKEKQKEEQKPQAVEEAGTETREEVKGYDTQEEKKEEQKEEVVLQKEEEVAKAPEEEETATPLEEEKPEIPEEELTVPEADKLTGDFKELKDFAKRVAKETERTFRMLTGKEYDPLTATAEERELYETIRENIRERYQAQRRILAFEQQLAQTEPRLQEIVEYIKNEIPAKKFRAMQEAYLKGDVETLAKLFNEVRREFYEKKVLKKSKKEAPQPPPVESAGTQPVETKQEFDPRVLRTVQDLEKKAELLPDDILPI